MAPWLYTTPSLTQFWARAITVARDTEADAGGAIDATSPAETTSATVATASLATARLVILILIQLPPCR
ncbi:hypothetical protein GCM10009765_51100 [Fodinicola feengrottensis]|uniref:Uncharacterized protein n=1 Tax=Fodinicola feengrottensis TaxID=435914 RepID=A0ABP4TXU6_9ACTN